MNDNTHKQEQVYFGEATEELEQLDLKPEDIQGAILHTTEIPVETIDTMETIRACVGFANSRNNLKNLIIQLNSQTFVESIKALIEKNMESFNKTLDLIQEMTSETFKEALEYYRELLENESEKEKFLKYIKLSEDELNELTPGEFQELAENYRAEQQNKPSITKYEKYDLKYFNEIPLFHSTIVNKIFGTFGTFLPIDGKSRDLASDTEYYVEEVNGKKLHKPLVIEASMENINELLEITGLTQFDFIVWCLANKCWNIENYFFTTSDLFKLYKQDQKAKASEYMLKRYENSIEKLSAIRLKVRTKDRNGNPKTELRNMITTAGETRVTANKKPVTGYIMLVPPALNGFSLEMNPFYNIPLDLLNYPTRGKQDRAACIASFLIQMIEVKKAELKKEKKAAYSKALRTAKEAEKQTALNEHRKPNNKNLDTEKYYPKIHYKKYRAAINVQTLCERVEETKEINKDIKSRIVSEAEKCLEHFQQKNYIKSFTIPAGKHNKTENIIVEIYDTEVPLEIDKK